MSRPRRSSSGETCWTVRPGRGCEPSSGRGSRKPPGGKGKDSQHHRPVFVDWPYFCLERTSLTISNHDGLSRDGGAVFIPVAKRGVHEAVTEASESDVCGEKRAVHDVHGTWAGVDGAWCRGAK
jgi:hypothetical protein